MQRIPNTHVVVVVGGGDVVGVVVGGGEVVGVVVGGAGGVVVGVVAGVEVVGDDGVELDAGAEAWRSVAGVTASRVVVPPGLDASITVAPCGRVVVVVPVASGAVVGDAVAAGTLFEATVADGETSRMTWAGSLGVDPPGPTRTRMARRVPTAARPPSMPLRCEGAAGRAAGSANSSWI